MTGHIRVGILSKTLGRGGAEMLILEQLKEGLETGRCSYSVGFLSSQDASLADEIGRLGVPVTAVAKNELGLVSSKQFRRWAADLDVLHVHSPLAASVLRILSRLPFGPRPRYVYTEHSMWDTYGQLTRLANRATFGLCNDSFVVSHHAHRSMSSSSQQRAEVLHHGIAPLHEMDRGKRTLTRSRLGIPPDMPALVNVANATDAKRHDLLVDLAIGVASRGYGVWHIGGGSNLETIKQYAKRQGSPLHFLGARNDVREVLPAFDGFVLTSDKEGLPVAIMEAISAKLPVATTDCGGVTELVEHNVNGLVSPVGDLAALTANCLLLLQPETQRRLAPGTSAAATSVNRRRFVDALEKRYLSLVRPPVSRTPGQCGCQEAACRDTERVGRVDASF